MRNRPFTLPLPKSEILTGSRNQGNLKNKFSGMILYRDNHYSLVTGNLSPLDKITNNWFLEELFTDSLTNYDLNLIPALKAVADSSKYTESIRQRASETIEIIEEHSVDGKDRDKISSARSEKEKAGAARKMLAGVRYPQTTDILRLLREKSPELKRLALYLIGKFHMTDMMQEVCQCLNTPGIEADAFSVLVSFGPAAAGDLNRFYLMSSGNITLSKAVLRIYSQSCPKDNMSFLVERVWSNSRQLKEIALKALLNCGYKAEKDDMERLNRIIFETFGLLARLNSGKVCLGERKDQLLYMEMDKEYRRWKDYLLNLLILAYGNEIPVAGRKNHFEKDENKLRYVPELAETIYGNAVKPEPDGVIPDGAADKKRLKKLQRFFPGEVPKCKDLLEDIINCDYNILSVWTKACTLRCMPGIEDEEMGESVVALLFSPEELLRQEAVLLIARSGKDLYRSTSERIPLPISKSLDKIIAGETESNELLYEKVNFLALCFPGVSPDELIFAAERMIVVRNGNPASIQNIDGAVLWSFRPDKTDPDIAVIHDNVGFGSINEKSASISFRYLLPLNVVEEFHFQYPESSFRILKYIDDKEE